MKRFPILSIEEIEKVIAAIASYRCAPKRKPVLIALYTLLANLGLRVSEALAVRVEDCDFERGEILIHTLKQRPTKKNTESTDDTLPLNDVTAAALRVAINGASPHDLVFPPPLSRRVAYNIFQRLLHHAGIRPIKLHALRHSAATRWIEETGNLVFTMHMMRHKNLATTSQYTHCANLREQFMTLPCIGKVKVVVGSLLLFLCVWSSAEAADWTWRTSASWDITCSQTFPSACA